MPSLQSPQDLFIYELTELLAAEQTVAQALTELQSVAQNPQLQQSFQAHEQETHQQIQNLQQAIQQMGGQPQALTCRAAEGLREDFMTLQQQQPSPDVLEMAAVAAAKKTEHLEIACYTGLVMKAQMMGQQEVAQLLQQNLQQEEQQAQRLMQLAQQLGQQALVSSGLGQASDMAAQI